MVNMNGSVATAFKIYFVVLPHIFPLKGNRFQVISPYDLKRGLRHASQKTPI